MAKSGNTWQKKLMAKSKTQWLRRNLGTEKRGMDNKDHRPGLVEVGRLPTLATFKPTREQVAGIIEEYHGAVVVAEAGRYTPAEGKLKRAQSRATYGDGTRRGSILTADVYNFEDRLITAA